MGDKAYTSSFAKIYDDIMVTVPYNYWYKYLLELLDYYQRKPKKVLDLACGTGNMSLIFAENNFQVTGIDASSQMLEIANKKAHDAGRNIEFIQADLRRFLLDKEIDLVFSLFDSLNYILTIEELEKVFQNVYKVLSEDGLFIFDMNTLKRLMSIEPGTTLFKGDNYICYWKDMVDREKKRWQVKLKIRFSETGEPFEEFHEETGYSCKQIANLLNKVGFQYVDIYNAYTFNKGSNNDNRLFFIAFKNISCMRKKLF